MRFDFHPQAADELDNAVRYYESQQTGLGIAFADEVYAAIKRIIAYPDAWPVLSPNTRRCLVNRFPYAIVYQAKPHLIHVVAVAHLHRKPNYWTERA